MKEKYIVIVVPEDEYATLTQIPYWEFNSKEEQQEGKRVFDLLIRVYRSLTEFVNTNKKKISKIPGVHKLISKEEDHIIISCPTATQTQRELIYEYNLKNNLVFSIRNYFFNRESSFTPWELKYIQSFIEEDWVPDLTKTHRLQTVVLGYSLKDTKVPQDSYWNVLKTLVVVQPAFHNFYSWEVL